MRLSDKEIERVGVFSIRDKLRESYAREDAKDATIARLEEVLLKISQHKINGDHSRPALWAQEALEDTGKE